MKQIYLLTTILFLTFINLNAQTVTITGSCFVDVDGDYNLSADMNGKPSYFHDPGNGFTYTIYWTGTRWELLTSDNLIACYNDLDTPTPPATSISPWTPDICDPAGVFSGSGTTMTLSTNEFELNRKLKLFPNPSSEFIQISGMSEQLSYKINNVLGAGIKKGIIANDEQIDIKNLTNGLYFLKFDDGNTIKFIKK